MQLVSRIINASQNRLDAWQGKIEPFPEKEPTTAIALEVLKKLAFIGGSAALFYSSYTVPGIVILFLSSTLKTSLQLQEMGHVAYALSQEKNLQNVAQRVDCFIKRFIWIGTIFSTLYLIGGAMGIGFAAQGVRLAYETQELTSLFFYLSAILFGLGKIISPNLKYLNACRLYKTNPNRWNDPLVKVCSETFQGMNRDQLERVYFKQIIQILVPSFFLDETALRYKSPLEQEAYFTQRHRYMTDADMWAFIRTFALKPPFLIKVLPPEKLERFLRPILEKGLMTQDDIEEIVAMLDLPFQSWEARQKQGNENLEGLQREVSQNLTSINTKLLKIGCFKQSVDFLLNGLDENDELSIPGLDPLFSQLFLQQAQLLKWEKDLLAQRNAVGEFWQKICPKNQEDDPNESTVDVLTNTLMSNPATFKEFIGKMNTWLGKEPSAIPNMEEWQKVFTSKGIKTRTHLKEKELLVSGDNDASLDKIFAFLGPSPAAQHESSSVHSAQASPMYKVAALAIRIFNYCLKASLIALLLGLQPEITLIGAVYGYIGRNRQAAARFESDLMPLWQNPPRGIPSMETELSLLFDVFATTFGALFFEELGALYMGIQAGRSIRFYAWRNHLIQG